MVPLWVWNLWRFKMTLAGRLLLGVWMLSAFGLISVNIPVYQTFCAFGALMFIAFFAGFLFRPRVEIQGAFPEKATTGVPIAAEFTVTNRSWRPAYDVSLGFIDLTPALTHRNRDVSVTNLAPGESMRVPVNLEPNRRGLHTLPELRAYSTFPFNLFRNGSSKQSMQPLLVLPSFHPLASIDVPASTRYQPGGIALTSNVGESPEYIGNREYVPGEPVRRIDFRSWARLGKPVVREYQEEYYCRIAVILDTHATPTARKWGLEQWDDMWYVGALEDPPKNLPTLEAAVSLTSAVADALSRGEYLIDLFAAGPELYVFQSGRHVAHFESMLEILACVEPCADNPFDTIGPALADELTKISTAVCVFLDWDASRRALCQSIVESGCSLKRIVIRDTPTTLPLYEDEFGQCEELTVKQVQAGSIEFL